MDKYTERGVVLLKREMQELSSGIHALIEQKSAIQKEIEKENKILEEKRSFLKAFEGLASNHLNRVLNDSKDAKQILGDILEEVDRNSSILRMLRTSVRTFKAPEQKFTFVEDVISRLKKELESYSGRWTHEEEKLFKAKTTRLELEKLITETNSQIGILVSRGNEVKAELGTSELLLNQNKEKRDKQIEIGNSTINQLDELAIAHISLLKAEEQSIIDSKENLQKECSKYTDMLSTLKESISTLEIPKSDFTFERQTAEKLTSQINTLELRNTDEKNEFERLSGLRKETEIYIDSLLMGKSILADEVSTYKKERDEARGQFEEANQKLLSSKQESQILSLELETLMNNIRDAGLEKQLTELALTKLQNKTGAVAATLEMTEWRKKEIENELASLISEKKQLEPKLEKLRSEIFLGNDKNGKLGLEYLKLQDNITSIKNRERNILFMQKKLLNNTI